jgi:hypothetical protein
MAASVTAICCESYSRPWSGAAWPRGWSFAVDASLIAADANKQRSAAGSNDVDWEAIARMRRSVREYLDTLDEAAWGAASETVLKFISKSDPAAQWTGAQRLASCAVTPVADGRSMSAFVRATPSPV